MTVLHVLGSPSKINKLYQWIDSFTYFWETERMYWIIQENLHREAAFEEIERVLTRMKIPHSYHKIVPFVGELIPDVNPVGPVMVIGSYSAIRTTRAKGWKPGIFSLMEIDFEDIRAHWGDYLLNADAFTCEFQAVPPQAEPFFMRPATDAKISSAGGKVYDWEEYVDWRHRTVELGEDYGFPTLTPTTRVLVATPKVIYREYRTWVIQGKIVTQSLYKEGDRVRYDARVDTDVVEFARQRAAEWMPADAYVLDVAETPEGFKIIEINNMNSAGFYAANIGKLIEALENYAQERYIDSNAKQRLPGLGN